MDETKSRSGIKVGPFLLQQEEGGRIVARHQALAEPLEVRDDQLARWLMRQVRDSIKLAVQA